MDVTIHENCHLEKDRAEIHCRQATEDILWIADFIRNAGTQISGRKDGAQLLLSLSQIYYFESVDKKTFACLEQEVFEVSLTLKDAEERFSAMGFVRINKSVVVNLYKIKEIRNDFEMRVLIRLDNEETLVISRHYRQAFRRCLDREKERMQLL